MPRNLLLLAMLGMLGVTAFITGCGLQPEVLAMRDVVSPEGYPGRAFFRNGVLASEELDSKGNGKVDLWRYYINNHLTREDFDTNGNGVIDTRKRYDNEGVLIEVLTDTTGDGRLDHIVRIVPEPAKQQAKTSKPADNKTKTPAKTSARATKTTTPPPATDGKRSVGAAELFGAQGNTTQPATPDPIPPLDNKPIAPIAETEPVPAQQPAKIEPVPVQPPATNSQPGSVIERIDPTGTGSSYPSGGRIVPGPVFKHPSEGLED